MASLGLIMAFSAPSVMAAANPPASLYRTTIQPIADASVTGVMGNVLVFVPPHDGDATRPPLIGYGGFASSLESDLDAAVCNATNGTSTVASDEKKVLFGCFSDI